MKNPRYLFLYYRINFYAETDNRGGSMWFTGNYLYILIHLSYLPKQFSKEKYSSLKIAY